MLRHQLARLSVLMMLSLGLSSCATMKPSDPIPVGQLSRNLFYGLQSSGVEEIECQQQMSDLGTKIAGRVLLDPSLTGVQLDILMLSTSPEMIVEPQNRALFSELIRAQGAEQDRILHSLMAAHVRYYQHVARNYLPIFYLQNPLDFAKNVAFQKVDNEFVTRYQEPDQTWIEIRIEQSGQYIKVLTSPFKGKTDMVLRYAPYEKRNLLQSIELTCLTPDCEGLERSTTEISYETIEGLPLIRKIGFNIGDGNRHENTTSVFTNLKCRVIRKM